MLGKFQEKITDRLKLNVPLLADLMELNKRNKLKAEKKANMIDKKMMSMMQWTSLNTNMKRISTKKNSITILPGQNLLNLTKNDFSFLSHIQRINQLECSSTGRLFVTQADDEVIIKVVKILTTKDLLKDKLDVERQYQFQPIYLDNDFLLDESMQKKRAQKEGDKSCCTPLKTTAQVDKFLEPKNDDASSTISKSSYSKAESEKEDLKMFYI